MTLLRKNGFSLIEVLIAMSIMMGTVIVVSMAWSGSQLRLKKMTLNNQAAFLLDYKVSAIEREYKQQLTLLPEADQGDFVELGKEYKKFTWSLTSKKFELPDLTPLLIQQGGAEGADQLLITMMDQLSDFFNKAAKEVTVTVVYNFGKKKVKYSASTFLIDFNEQLPLPGGGGVGP